MSSETRTGTDKAAQRTAAKARRAEAALELGEEGAKAFLEVFARHWGDLFGEDGVIAGYWPIRGEMDVRPALVLLDRLGCTAALPTQAEEGRPLSFRAWKPGDDLEEGPMGIPHPLPTAPLMRPDVVLAPLLAFDRAGYRLGWGGGHYDRTLEVLRKTGDVVCIGAAFGAQECDSIIHDDLDQKLDWVVTEKEVIRIS